MKTTINQDLKIAGYVQATKNYAISPDGELVDLSTATLEFVDFYSLTKREQNAAINHGFNPPERRAPLRTITPHKGGRTVDFHVRMRPETKARIDALAAERDCSQADLIEHW